MLAKPEWFSPRKYGGWGISPNCWQGWAYIAVVAAPIIVIPYLQLPGMTGSWLMGVWSVIFAADVIDIMVRMKKDEREMMHEAIAERNAMWFMVAILAAGVAWQVASGVVKNTNEVDPVILVALIGATLVKALTHWYLREK